MPAAGAEILACQKAAGSFFSASMTVVPPVSGWLFIAQSAPGAPPRSAFLVWAGSVFGKVEPFPRRPSGHSGAPSHFSVVTRLLGKATGLLRKVMGHLAKATSHPAAETRLLGKMRDRAPARPRRTRLHPARDRQRQAGGGLDQGEVRRREAALMRTSSVQMGRNLAHGYCSSADGRMAGNP